MVEPGVFLGAEEPENQTQLEFAEEFFRQVLVSRVYFARRVSGVDGEFLDVGGDPGKRASS